MHVIHIMKTTQDYKKDSIYDYVFTASLFEAVQSGRRSSLLQTFNLANDFFLHGTKIKYIWEEKPVIDFLTHRLWRQFLYFMCGYRPYCLVSLNWIRTSHKLSFFLTSKQSSKWRAIFFSRAGNSRQFFELAITATSAGGGPSLMFLMA